MGDSLPFLPRRQGSLTPADDADDGGEQQQLHGDDNASQDASSTSSHFIPPLDQDPFQVPLNDNSSADFPVEDEGNASITTIYHEEQQEMDDTQHVSNRRNRGRDISPRPMIDEDDEYAEWRSSSSDSSSSPEPLIESSSSSSDSPPSRRQQQRRNKPIVHRRSRSLGMLRRSPSPGLPTVTEFERASFEMEDEILLESFRQQRSRSAEGLTGESRKRRATKGSKAEIANSNEPVRDRQSANNLAADILSQSPVKRRSKQQSPRKSRKAGFRSNSSETLPKTPLPVNHNNRRELLVKSNSSPSLLRYSSEDTPPVPPPPSMRTPPKESPRTLTKKKHALQSALHGLEEELYQIASQDIAWPRSRKKVSDRQATPKSSQLRKRASPKNSPKNSPNSLRKRSGRSGSRSPNASPKASPKSLRKLAGNERRSPNTSPATSPATLRKVAAVGRIGRASPKASPKNSPTDLNTRKRSPAPKKKVMASPPTRRTARNPGFPSKSVFDLSNDRMERMDGAVVSPRTKKKTTTATTSGATRNSTSTAALTSHFQNRFSIRRHHSGNTVEQILGLASTISSASNEELTTIDVTDNPSDVKVPFRSVQRARSFDSPRGRRKNRQSSEIEDLQQHYYQKWYGGSPSSVMMKGRERQISEAKASNDPPPRSPMRTSSPPPRSRPPPPPPPSMEDLDWE